MAKARTGAQATGAKWLVAACEARQALLEGRFAHAERLITEAHDVGESAQSWNAAVTYRLPLYVLRREQGRLEQVEESVRRSVEEYPTYPICHCVLATWLRSSATKPSRAKRSPPSRPTTSPGS